MKQHTELALWSIATGAFLAWSLFDLRDSRRLDVLIDLFMAAVSGCVAFAAWLSVDDAAQQPPAEGKEQSKWK